MIQPAAGQNVWYNNMIHLNDHNTIKNMIHLNDHSPIKLKIKRSNLFNDSKKTKPRQLFRFNVTDD